MNRTFGALLLLHLCAAAGAQLPPPPPAPAVPAAAEASRSALAEVEREFARSFAERDLDRFAAFLAEDAVFLAGDGRALRGKAAILEGWKGFFDGAAPFSWYPTVSEVAGDLGLSQGPVLSPEGEWLANFSSLWRRQEDGTWKIVFDGAPPCRSLAEPPP